MRGTAEAVQNRLFLLWEWWEAHRIAVLANNAPSQAREEAAPLLTSDNLSPLLQDMHRLSQSITALYDIIGTRNTLSSTEAQMIKICESLSEALKQPENTVFPNAENHQSLTDQLLPTQTEIWKRRMTAIGFYIAAVILIFILSMILMTPSLNPAQPFIFFPMLCKAAFAFWRLGSTPYEEYAVGVVNLFNLPGLNAQFNFRLPMPSMLGLPLYALTTSAFLTHLLCKTENLNPAIEVASKKVFHAAATLFARKILLSDALNPFNTNRRKLASVLEKIIQLLQAGLTAYRHGLQKYYFEEANRGLIVIEGILKAGCNIISGDDHAVFNKILSISLDSYASRALDWMSRKCKCIKSADDAREANQDDGVSTRSTLVISSGTGPK